MKICMIGLGSIGKRHLGNLMAALEKRGIKYQIDALRSGHTALQEKWDNIICRQFFHADELPSDYEIIFITNPTSLHYDTIRKVVSKTKHMFIEKPVFESIEYDLKALPLRKNGIYYVACPLRHKNIMKYVKQKIVPNEKIVSVRVISTSFLPAWRDGVDYRTIYSAKENMGGGATKDLIHEWDYVKYLFGVPDKVFHMKDHVSDLEIDSDDVSIYMARYSNMLLEMHLDYVGHKTERMLQMFTSSKRIDIDLLSNCISRYERDKLIDKEKFSPEDFYMNEIEYFLDCIEGKQDNMNTIADAYQTLKIALTKE